MNTSDTTPTGQQNVMGIQNTAVPTIIPTEPLLPTATPTITPTNIPSATKIISPTKRPVQPTALPLKVKTDTDGGFACNCSKTCPNMSCSEAQYQLKVCGCKARDADKDGIACDAQCQ